RSQQVDVVHVTERPRDAMFGLLLARLAGCACLIHAHTSYYPHEPTFTLAASDWVLRQADAVVGVSDFTAGTFRRDAGIAPERVFAVHNAVDEGVLQAKLPDDAGVIVRRRLGISPDALVVGTVGRLMRGKDQASVVEAFGQVRAMRPDARLVIAGTAADTAPDGRGDYGDYLRRRVDDLGLHEAVTFTGLLPHREMPRLYAAFDLFVHPCVEEPFGLVVVEAMSRMLPVIAVSAGGVPEIVRPDVDGLLVPPRQPAALAEAITTLVNDPARAARLARSGRDRVLAAFTARAQAQTMLRVYLNLVPTSVERASGVPGRTLLAKD
ncbi:MAG TPA: glycosyltransferase family 4 protein, partial [Chloroflexota bacterium]